MTSEVPARFRRIVIVGRVASPHSLESHLAEGAQSLGLRTSLVEFNVRRAALSPRLPVNARSMIGFAARRRLCAELGSLDLGRHDVILLVKCAGAFMTVNDISILRSMTHGQIILLAPDLLDTFLSDELRDYLFRVGVRLATFDPATERAKASSADAGLIVPFAFGYSPRQHWRTVDLAGAQRDDSVLFAGTWDPKREAAVKEIARHVPVMVYGNYWNRARTAAGVRRISGSNLYGSQLADLVQRHTVALNIPRNQNVRLGNMRTYEIPAQGGMQAAAPSHAHFKHGLFETSVEALAERIIEWNAIPRSGRLESILASQAEVFGLHYGERIETLLHLLSFAARDGS